MKTFVRIITLAGMVSTLTIAPARAQDDAEKENVQALDSMIEALRKMENRKAIPALAKVVRNSAMDNDSRWLAMQNLGRLVRRRFDKGTDPMDAAIQWLDGHGF